MKITLNKNQKLQKSYIATFHTKRLIKVWLRNTKRVFLSHWIEEIDGGGKPYYLLHGEEIVKR